MKIPVSIRLMLVGILFCASTSLAQVSNIYTIAGNGTAGFSGDGGPAGAAELRGPTDVCTDHAGNLYIADRYNNRIRKVNKLTSIITTVAGTGVAGYTGDGGPAVAATINTPNGIAVDGADNLYIADQGNNVIRKVSTAGIITTVAGTGIAGFTGDGGPAASAQFNAPTSVAVDGMYNLYVGDYGNSRIRKIDVSGTITTVGGGGTAYFATNGVSATSVKLCLINHLSVDASGNIYFSNLDCTQYLKITSAGLIYLELDIPGPWGVCNDIAGNVYMCTGDNIIVKKNAAGTILDTIVKRNTTGHYSGDGGPALTAGLNQPHGMYADIVGNLYVADANDSRIRLITSSIIATYNSDSFSVFVNELCGGPELTISANRYGSGFNQTTYFGDGTSSSSSLILAYGGTSGYSTFSHTYSLPGTYTLKTIFRNGVTIIDSYVYTYQCKMCNIIQGRFYIDQNNSMTYEPSTDILSGTPVTVEIDSNGIPVDTLTATSGFYYTANGAPGDIYKLKIISVASGLIVTSPSSGVLLDTIRSGIYNVDIKNFGLNCSGIPGFDFSIHTANRAGHHHFGADIVVNNSYCSSPAIVTVKVSSKYLYQNAHPAPTGVVGNTFTWNFPSITADQPTTHITIDMEKPSSSSGYNPGDTVHSLSIINPTTGDVDTSNNTCDHIDTVKSGYDPNFIEVTPVGYVPAGAKLQYTIGFENTGNDTAHNIYILDTLSDNLDPSTLRIVTASAPMDIFKFTYSGHTVVKFDFPAINILDSSHHGQCTGMVIYTVNAKTGLPDCSRIVNEAGIYFDENPVVMTNPVENIIGPPPVSASLSGASNVCLGNVITLSADIAGGTWSVNNSNAMISATGDVTGITSGNVIVYYTIPATCAPVTSIFEINVGLPNPGAIISSPAICLGSSISLVSSAVGGVWSVFNGNATVSGDTLTGITTGTDTVYYTVTSVCGSSTTAQLVNIETFPVAGIIHGPASVCIGATVALSDSVLGGIWSSTSQATVSIGGVVTGVAAGTATVDYSVSNSCGTAYVSNNISVIDCTPTTGFSNISRDNSVHIFPNPANDALTIMTDRDIYSSCLITNNVGQVLIRQDIAGIQTQINVKMLPAGVYYLALKGIEGNTVYRFIKQ